MPSKHVRQHQTCEQRVSYPFPFVNASTKRSVHHRQDGKQVVSDELRNSFFSYKHCCQKDDEKDNPNCRCVYNPEDPSCHCFTHFVDDPTCSNLASVDCSADSSNPNCHIGPSDDSAASATADIIPSTTTTDSILSTPTPTPTPETNGTGLPSITSTQVPTAKTLATTKINVPIVVGGIIAGLVALALIALTMFLCVRRRRKQAHRAPSAEFLDGSGGLLTRTRTGGSLPIQSPPVSVYGGVLVTADGIDGNPPNFSPGLYTDPIIEKAAVSAQNLAASHRRDVSQQNSGDFRLVPQRRPG